MKAKNQIKKRLKKPASVEKLTSVMVRLGQNREKRFSNMENSQVGNADRTMMIFRLTGTEERGIAKFACRIIRSAALMVKKLGKS